MVGSPRTVLLFLMKCRKKSFCCSHYDYGLSELKSILIDEGVGARDKREDSFPLKDPAILRMRLVSDGGVFEIQLHNN